MRTKATYIKVKCTTIIFILICYKSFSQYFEGGIFLGFTASQIDGDTYSGYHQPGLTGGVYTSRRLTNNLKCVIELKYVAKGARETGDKDEAILDEQKLRYVEIPVKLNYHIEKFRTDIEAGINSGYLFYDKDEYKRENHNYKFELSWMIGAMYHISDNLFLSAQFNYSLLPIARYENPDDNYGFIPKIFGINKGDYNNVVQFMLYYQFGKK